MKFLLILLAMAFFSSCSSSSNKNTEESDKSPAQKAFEARLQARDRN